MPRILSLLVLLTLLIPSMASARVDILPHLLVVEGRARSTEVTVLNLSDGPSDFKVSLLSYSQDEKGLYTKLEGSLSELFNIDEIVRVSPKDFRLERLGRQKIRVALRKPSDLPDGEYRFHLLATGYAAPAEKELEGGEGPSISLAVNVGVAIPVIVRHGDDLSATGKLKDFKLVDESTTGASKPELTFTATREGNISTLGRVEVHWAPEGEKSEQIGFITNFNLFTEINERYGAVPLKKAPSGKGRLRIIYTDTETKVVYDEVIIDQ